MIAFAGYWFAVCIAAQQPSAAPPDNKYVAEAKARVDAGDLDGALEAVEKAIADNPELPPAQLLFASVLFQGNHWNAARAVLERAAVERPDHPEVFATFGRLALAENRLTDAALHFDRAIQLASSDRWPAKRRAAWMNAAHAGSAVVAERRGDWLSAYASLYILSNSQNDPRTKWRLGRAAFFRGETDRASKLIAEACAADNSLGVHECQMGDLWMQKGDVAQAEKWYIAASKAPRDAGRGHLALANLYLAKGQTAEARQHADEAVRQSPNDGAAHLAFVQTLRQAKDWDAARAAVQRWKTIEPNAAAARNQDLLIRLDSGDAVAAKAALADALALLKERPTSGLWLTTVGWAYYRAGDLPSAERSLRTALFNADATPDTAYFQAKILADKGERAAAVRLLERTLAAKSAFVYRAEAESLKNSLKK